MKYTKYRSDDALRADVLYPVIFPDALVAQHLSLTRSSFVRWTEDGTDLVALMYIGFKCVGTKQFLDRMLFVTEGHGKRCDEPTSAAPTSQVGRFSLNDGRPARWAIGIADNGWDPKGPYWVSWTSKHGGATYRLQGRNLGLSELRSLAAAVADSE